MNRLLVCVALICCTVITGCVAITQVRTKPDPGDPVALQPQFCVGDRIVTKGYYSKSVTDIFTTVVKDIKNDGSVEAIEKSEDNRSENRLFITKNLGISRRVNIKTGKDLFVRNPPEIRLNFPLFVGKMWKGNYSGKSISGSKFDYICKYLVTDYKPIKTQCGTFEAFRIRKTITSLAFGMHGETPEEIYYYAPKIRSVVKSLPSWRVGSEIVDYSLNDCITDSGKPKAKVVTEKVKQKPTPPRITSRSKVTTEEFEQKTIPPAIVSQSKTKKIITITKKGGDKYWQGNNWAVVVGISQYQYAGKNGLSDLIFADDDAFAFADTLKNLGWSKSHIKLLTNEKATQRNLTIALKSWLTKAKTDDLIIVFWAGHGYPDPDDPEKVYFSTYDTDLSIPATGYRMDEVRRAIEEIGAKNVIFFADTCHAGKIITRGGRGISIIPKLTQMRRDKDIPKGWIYMVGADTDRQAIENTAWANGAFTHSLLKGLRGEADGFESAGPVDGIVTMGELKDYMKTAMPETTLKILGVAKHPVITTSTGDHDIWNLTFDRSK